MLTGKDRLARCRGSKFLHTKKLIYCNIRDVTCYAFLSFQNKRDEEERRGKVCICAYVVYSESCIRAEKFRRFHDTMVVVALHTTHEEADKRAVGSELVGDTIVLRRCGVLVLVCGWTNHFLKCNFCLFLLLGG